MRHISFILLLMLSATTFAQTRPTTAAARNATTAPQHKMWVNNLGGYLRTHPGNYFVARSKSPALTAGEALAGARHVAAKQLMQNYSFQYQGIPYREALAELENSLNGAGMIADEEVTSTDKSYGVIYSAAILVNQNPQKLAIITNRMQRRSMIQKIHFAQVAISSVVLVLAVACIYLVLNAATRGFFRTKLALGSVVVIIGGIFVISHLL